ncbi:conjugal transfer protein TraW [Enterobacter hormaechei]|uniref:Conjugal transfer protein n=5 Tax=Enterobacteriaceae TaxID=543 RepID=A0A2J0PRW7_9ENTR|nr:MULTISPECIES: conjugal transfer protein TraW [Enterobacteriaceae]ASB76923.1 conjugal transfer protein [Enterobacter cloacae complex sp.]MEB0846400.1 conjugal transfer protein TraW [Citrobacter freundii]RYA69173.1 conjugal transfer protein [Enterobacter cloacae complex sp. 2DZ2F16B1]HDU4966532.1 conjugal transfer protein TraW [Klebsiella pneumoniae subsp. pneumoniae]AJB79312.1 conjugal transfer protein [Enterobacter hormaechei subsp. steigerwaltii]
MLQRHLPALALAIASSLPTVASALTVNVNSSVPITTQVLPEMATIQATLVEILQMQQATGTAITQNADKLGALINQDGQATRQQMIFNNETQRLEEARQSFSVPDSICSDSASGVAAQSKSASGSAASKLSSGKGVSSSAVRKRISTASEEQARDAYDGANVHAAYCTAAEYERFGGTGICPAVSNLPGGDSQVRSIYGGAGPEGQAPALSWSQEQIDAAMAYMKNTARPSAGRTPGKGEVNTVTGRTYVGLLNEYNGIIDAASEPQLSLIADSKTSETTRDALKEALQSPSAAQYFDNVASPEAKAKGYMSQREFESFEAGRRYANTAYLSDLQQMDGDNLMRELIRTTAQMNWQLNDIKELLRKGNVIDGQLLAAFARQSYAPRLKQLESAMNQGAAK